MNRKLFLFRLFGISHGDATTETYMALSGFFVSFFPYTLTTCRHTLNKQPHIWGIPCKLPESPYLVFGVRRIANPPHIWRYTTPIPNEPF